RYDSFEQRLKQADEKWLAEMKPYAGRKIVTYHRSWPNFAEHFHLDVVGYVEPRPGIPPSPQHTVELIGQMKRDGVKVIVVEPYVIFVDLALAQIAALGATVAVVVGMDPHGRAAYWISLAFTFIGAGIFAFARSSRGHIPQEAFIGIAYAVASATAILLMSKATGETEHLKDMLVGNILAVSWPEVRRTAF